MRVEQMFRFALGSLVVLIGVALQTVAHAECVRLDINDCAFEFVSVPGCKLLFGKTELTQKQWLAIMRSNPSVCRGDNLPVENISWNDAKAFVDKLNGISELKRKGYVAAMPSEEEWMVACGPAPEDYSAAVWDRSNSGRKTHPVASKGPNRYGLYDMLGNVYEYCRDIHGKDEVWPKGGCWNTKRPTADWHGKNKIDDRNEKLGMRLCLHGEQMPTPRVVRSVTRDVPEVSTKHSLVQDTSYREHLSAFSGPCRLWIGGSLFDKLLLVKKRITCYAIFERSWTEDKSIYAIDLSGGKVERVAKEVPDGKRIDVSASEFQELCNQRAMLGYNNRVYLNAPVSTVAAGQDGPIGFLLLGGIYGLRADLGIAMPTDMLCACVKGGRSEAILVRRLGLMDTLTCEKMVEGVCECEQQKLNAKWKKDIEKKRKQLPRKPPVVYGNVEKIVKKSDGTFIIPKEAPATSRTIKWKETIWAEGRGTTAYGTPVSVSVPVGERECQRTKKITCQYNYEELRQKLEEYEKLVSELENSKPEKVDAETVRRIFSQISAIEFKVEE